MEILILGGGVFLGRACLDAAVARGHSVTVFNRGRSRAYWPIEVEAVAGDRTQGLAPLAGRRFDAVIDTCAYRPQDLELACTALRDSVASYCLVSSVSAYASLAHAPLLETDPAAALDDHDTETVSGANYGPLKAECERVLSRHFGERSLIVRPGLIVGPDDPTGRFSYWVWRGAAGGRVLAPGRAGRRIQCIDARDLAAWLVDLLEVGGSGSFNATGPVCGDAGGSLGELIESALDLAGSAGEIEWVGDDFLLAQGVAPWTELPLWLPESDPQTRGLYSADLGRARSAGLRTRPLAQTMNDILAAGVPPMDDRRRAGKLAPAREAELLAAWDAVRTNTPSR